MNQLKARLRTCASCEWIFDGNIHKSCPMCGFASYGAKFVYGDKAYKYKYTQEPYKNRLLSRLSYMIESRIEKNNDFKKPQSISSFSIYKCEDM